MSIKTVFLKLTGALAIEGAIIRAGHVIEVSEADAKQYLRRGKAVLHKVETEVVAKVETAVADLEGKTSPAPVAPAAPAAPVAAPSATPAASGAEPPAPATGAGDVDHAESEQSAPAAEGETAE